MTATSAVRRDARGGVGACTVLQRTSGFSYQNSNSQSKQDTNGRISDVLRRGTHLDKAEGIEERQQASVQSLGIDINLCGLDRLGLGMHWRDRQADASCNSGQFIVAHVFSSLCGGGHGNG